MSYTAQPPAPPTLPTQEFTVEFAHMTIQPNEWVDFERRIAQTLASLLGTAVTVNYQPPF